MKGRRRKAAVPIVAVDTGGTFTDFFVLSPEGVRSHKVLSTPRDPSRAVARGLKELGLKGAYSLVHGSTVATNALLERKGARVALVTTAGFEDVVEIGRQERPCLYALEPRKTPPLVARRLRFGLAERIGAGGKVLRSPSAAELKALRRRLRGAGVESLALCLLHAYANPAHERLAARFLKTLGKPLSVSSEICPEFREYERSSTVCVNAYVAPVMARYLRRLQKRLRRPVRILQSNGGGLSVAEASRQAVRTLLSGPAGGALGALRAAEAAGFRRLLTLDMGGTSTDMSLIDGALEFTSEAALGDYPVKTPMIRIDTIGAGGGSLAWIDAGGALRVGPRSAGADPGPICYGRGGRQLTVTDAHVALGRIPPRHFLGGRMRLFPERIEAPLGRLAKRLGLSPREAAEGIIAVANANMARSLRVLSLQRGHDPRRFALFPFGGAGALHAAELAEALQIPQVLVPPNPGLLSAYGMAFAEWRRDYVRTVLWREEEASPAALRRIFEELRAQARRDARAERVAPRALRFAETLDLRYAGQSFELGLAHRPGFRQAFDAAHRRRYGHAYRGRAIEVVNLRLQVTAPEKRPEPAETAPQRGSRAAPADRTNLYWRGDVFAAPVYLRGALPARASLAGPALVAEFSATTFVPPGWRLRRLPGGALLLTRDGRSRA
ncbi:hydantoinase/oxoprolinase family protein [Deltaproteobacteria bacterium PRO3]|nr:hydantoinase/oxoprolinase family protein [Deltaproteobacteria bacterium PRO3]